jgi:protein-disulfide isomerase
MGGLLRNFLLRIYFWVPFIILSAGCCCLIIGVYAMSSYPIAESQPAQQPPAFLLPEVSMGDATAPHKVIMYFALDCTHCREYERHILPKIKERFIDTRQVHFILRQFPMGPAGLLASKVSWARRDPQHCREMVMKIFDKQEYWNVVDDYTVKLREVALGAGLTAAEFDACLNDKGIEQAILWQQLQAKDIVEVPTFVIDGEPISEILTPEVLTTFLENKVDNTKSKN